MKPEAGHTLPDEIPPVHVLEAAHKQDRKETEDLLAGFDRPGRGPKKPSAERDFVDYYAKKKGGPDSGRTSGAAPGAKPPRQIDVSTVVKPRKREGLPVCFGWVAAALLMLGIGGVVAYVATDEARPGAGKTGVGSAGPATTITGASTPVQSSRDMVPPPGDPDPATTTPLVVAEPAPAVTDVAPPRAAGRHDLRGAPSASTSSGSTAASGAQRKPPPRDDFIRDL